jgi:hypothetical protein
MPIARMNNCSSTARLAATDWLVSRQCTSSAPCSFAPVGSVPGIRLESAQNALRPPPGGRRNGQATKPGFRFKLGLSARRATSVPETTDWRKKFVRSAASGARLKRDTFAGRKRKLVHVAPATARNPIGRSAGAHPEIMSQKMRKSADRLAAARARPARAVSDVALKGLAQPAKPRRCTVAQTAAQRPASWESGHADRSSGSASETATPALRRCAELTCSTQQGKQRRPRARAGN